MEQLEPIVYRFQATVRRGDGSETDFSVDISTPTPSGEGDSVCQLSCPFLRQKPFSIFGIDDQQALELSRDFVEISLGHMNAWLVDSAGDPVTLPPVPKLN